MLMEKYYNPFREKTVKENDDYVLGLYVNRVPVFGLYIEGKENFIKDLEIKSKGKFKLECDPENYAQEVRTHYYTMLDKYISKFGEPESEEKEKEMISYICKGCLNKLKDLARGMKGKVSYYDKEKEDFVMISLMSLERCKESEALFDSMEYMIFAQNDSNENSYNDFSNWFNNNKESLLTKKQIDYLNDSTVVDRSNQKKIEKNIVKRIDRKYSDLTIRECKKMELERKINLIDGILDSDTSTEMLKKIVGVMDSEDWLLKSLYSAELETCKLLTDATKGHFYKNKKTHEISTILIEKAQELESFLKKY